MIDIGRQLKGLLPVTAAHRDRTLFYLRLSQHAVSASASLAAGEVARAFLHIQTVRQLTAQTRDYGEEHVYQRIHRAAGLLLDQRRQILQAARHGGEVHGAQSALLAIENLCMIRILQLLFH